MLLARILERARGFQFEILRDFHHIRSHFAQRERPSERLQNDTAKSPKTQDPGIRAAGPAPAGRPAEHGTARQGVAGNAARSAAE